jgi:hypothetical protein
MITSKTAEEHLVHIQKVLQRLKDHQLLAHESKCHFFQSDVKFLGYMFSELGKAVDPSKTAAIRQITPPTTVHDLQRWLAAVNYYCNFIDKYAEIIAPLTDLLQGSSQPK